MDLPGQGPRGWSLGFSRCPNHFLLCVCPYVEHETRFTWNLSSAGGKPLYGKAEKSQEFASGVLYFAFS